MHTLVVAQQDGLCHLDVPLSALATQLANSKATVWLDLAAPDEAELALLTTVFSFHPLAIEDVVRQQQRPKVDRYEGYYFVVFYSACYEEETARIKLQPLNLFIGPNYLVSIHGEPIEIVAATAVRWQAPNSPLGRNVGALVYALLDAIVDEYFPLVDALADRVDALEEQIFENFSDKAIENIFGLKKDLLALRRVMAPERDVINIMLRREIPVFSAEDTVYLQDVYDHVIRVAESLDTYRDLLSSALDSFLSVQSNRLNQVVKVLTITSIVLMSSALIAGIYGMNFDFMPELHWRYGYLWALGLMVAISGALIGFFRYKDWL